MKEQFLQDCQNLTAETWPADTLVKEKTQSQLKITSVQRSMSKLWLVCKHIKEKNQQKKTNWFSENDQRKKKKEKNL